MQIIQTNSGQIGFKMLGPKFFLNEEISPGKAAICINVDPTLGNKKAIWILGSPYELKVYLSLDDIKEELGEEQITTLNKTIDEIEKMMPTSPIERLASALCTSKEELEDALSLSKVEIK